MEEETTVEKEKIMQNKRICLIGGVVDDLTVKEAANKFKCPVISSLTGEEHLNDHSWTTYFILSSFDCPEFDRLNSSKHK